MGWSEPIEAAEIPFALELAEPIRREERRLLHRCEQTAATQTANLKKEGAIQQWDSVSDEEGRQEQRQVTGLCEWGIAFKKQADSQV